MALTEWTTSIQSQTKWRDRENNIYDEDYNKTRELKLFKLRLFKRVNTLDMKHDIDEFCKGGTVGFKKSNG